jgi:hypothetical protein
MDTWVRNLTLKRDSPDVRRFENSSAALAIYLSLKFWQITGHRDVPWFCPIAAAAPRTIGEVQALLREFLDGLFSDEVASISDIYRPDDQVEKARRTLRERVSKFGGVPNRVGWRDAGALFNFRVQAQKLLSERFSEVYETVSEWEVVMDSASGVELIDRTLLKLSALVTSADRSIGPGGQRRS